MYIFNLITEAGHGETLGSCLTPIQQKYSLLNFIKNAADIRGVLKMNIFV